EQDVHLLENAFSCCFDDFYPQSMIIDCENLHYPAETFPQKISKLRKKLFDSALILSENNESQIFKNFYHNVTLLKFLSSEGFIPHMKAVWEEINASGNFLYFKDSKTIQQWSAMERLVNSYNETTIKSFEENGLKLIEEQTNKGQWNDIAFETYLTQESENFCTETITNFIEKVSSQYEAQIIDEGETHIKAAFSSKKQELKVIYVKKQRQFKESWLIKSAEMRIGETIGNILREHKDKTPDEFKNYFSESKCKELFNEEWEKVENDKENFVCAMIKEGNMLEKHSNSGERLKIDKIFWNHVLTPKTLNQVEFLDDTDKKFTDSIKIKDNNIGVTIINVLCQNNAEKNDFKKTVINKLKTEIEDTCKQIHDDILSRNVLAIEFDQALEWLKTLCDNIFIVQNGFNGLKNQFKVQIENFSSMEQYLRFKVFTALKNSTMKWKSLQQKNLNNLRENLSKYFYNILSNSSYENIAIHFFEYIAKSVENQLVIQEKYISKVLEMDLKQNWMNKERNLTRYAYEQSFGVYDVEKTHIKVKERFEKIEKAVNDALEKLGGVISICHQHFLGSTDKNLPFEKIISNNRIKNTSEIDFKKFSFTLPASLNETICPESLMEDAIYVLGKCIISTPQDFCIILKEYYNKYVQEFNTLWRSQRADLCKKSLIDCIENSKNCIENSKNCIENSKKSYWNKVKGCRHRCPYCGSKCELSEHEPNTNHRASIHLMKCFGGVRKLKTREASLKICNEPESFDIKFKIFSDKDYIMWKEYLKVNHPEWWQLYERKEPDEDQIKQARAMWMHLKTELCSKYNMVDNTPENWHKDYAHLAKK
ncbi:2185_t:CDS:2, partial [Dentiscutata erythropus]